MTDTMTLEEVRGQLSSWFGGSEACGDVKACDRLGEMINALDAAIKQREHDKRDAARYRWMRKADQDKVEVYFANSELPGGWNDWNAWANKDDGIDHYMQESDHD